MNLREEAEKIIRLTGAEDSSGLREALVYRLVQVWDHRYNDGVTDVESINKCPYTFSHTKEWCGYENYRES